MAMEYQHIIEEVYANVVNGPNPGNVASYIPELGHIDPDKFGVHLVTTQQTHASVGDSSEKFSIQSISKVLALAFAYKLVGAKIWERVGVEPSGTAFNSLVQLEMEQGIPRNPMINAGAIVMADIIVAELERPMEKFLSFVRSLSQNEEIAYDQQVVQSETITGHRNAAVINLLKSFGNITGDITEVLDFYYHMCSIAMSCKELSETYLFLANHGMSPFSGEEVLNKSQTKRLNAIMHMCGFYDEAGEFSYKVGLPGKSGVGGGIIAVHPGHYCIAVWSPVLNAKGNSYRGMQFLEQFTTETGLSIF